MTARTPSSTSLVVDDVEVTEAIYRGACVALVLAVVIMNDWMPVLTLALVCVCTAAWLLLDRRFY
jgi:hypothetical protein